MMKFYILLLIACCSGCLLAQNQKELQAPGNLVDIGGYKLHLNIKGQGSHTIVIEAGGGSWTLFWEKFQSELAKHARVVIYDRAGYGWSEASPYSRTVEQIADELHTALLNAGLKPPFILAGHSYGGVVIKAFENKFSGDVSGLIFYEAAHEGQFEILPPVSKMAVQRGMADYKKRAQEVRAGKFTPDNMEIDSSLSKLNWRTYQVHKARASQSEAFYNEMLLFPGQCAGDIIAKPISKPVCVLSAGNSFGAFRGLIPEAMINDSNRKWMELQKKTAGISTKSKHIIADGATHRLTETAPDKMVEAAVWVMDQLKN